MIPLKNPSSQSEYASDLREAFESTKDVAQEHLAKSRKRQQDRYDSQSQRKWVPVRVGQWLWLRRPKHWEFGKRWRGPYKVQSQRGVNYQVEAKDKKTLVVHHNQLKACAIPRDGGKPVCPVPETGEIEVIYGPLLGEREPCCANQMLKDHNRFARPNGKTSGPQCAMAIS